MLNSYRRLQMRASRLKTFAKSFIRSYGKQKIFCVGLNKTGTTSLARALENLGIVVAPQGPVESLIQDWSRRDFLRIIRFCRYYEAFQDVPFSCPFTFQALDAAFSGSKFILTVRQDSYQWSESLIRFHTKVFGRGQLPGVEDLRAAPYCYPGYALDWYRALFRMDGGCLYDPNMLHEFYNSHNASVLEYFRHRPKDLLVLNVSSNTAFADLCRFLGKEFSHAEFPWENRTENIVMPGTEQITKSVCSPRRS
jgi:hypothetical protein